MQTPIYLKPIIEKTSIDELTENDLFGMNNNLICTINNSLTIDSGDKYNTLLENLKQLSPILAEILKKIGTESSKFEVIFPKGVLEKIKSGELNLMQKKGSDEYFAIIKDRISNKIINQLTFKEIKNIDKANELANNMGDLAIQTALHNILQKLQDIEEKLIHIHHEFNIDRVGLIQSGYNLYLESLPMDISNKKRTLHDARTQTKQGISQLIESITYRIKKINKNKPGWWNGFFEELFSHRIKKKMHGEISEIMKELFYIQRGTQLIIMIYYDLNEKEAANQSLKQYQNIIKKILEPNFRKQIHERGDKKINWEETTSRIQESIEKVDHLGKQLIYYNESEYIIKLN